MNITFEIVSSLVASRQLALFGMTLLLFNAYIVFLSKLSFLSGRY